MVSYEVPSGPPANHYHRLPGKCIRGGSKVNRGLEKKKMVGARLPLELLADLEMIERTDQLDRSTTIRRLLERAIADWKHERNGRRDGAGISIAHPGQAQPSV